MDNAVATPPGTQLEPARHSGLSRLAAALLLALALSGCATQRGYLNTGQDHLDGDTYKVGPITVMIRPQPEVEQICKLQGAKVPTTVRIYGCYVPADKMIVSTANHRVLLHEFKHHFEGGYHE